MFCATCCCGTCQNANGWTSRHDHYIDYAHAALVLPDAPTPIATRELFYTAVTRAKRLFTLVEVKPELTRRVIGRAIYRASQMFPTA